MASTPANLLTIVSTGLADSRLEPPKGNPETSQFVKVMRKTTRWASQTRKIEFDGEPNFGIKASITIPRLAELVGNFTLVVTLPDIYTTQLNAIKASGGTSFTNVGDFLGPMFSWTNSAGHALIQLIELEIGGAIVDRMDGRLLEILDELYEPLETLKAKNTMIARNPTNFNQSSFTGSQTNPQKLYIPLPFWFSKGQIAQFLPIDAISAETVKVHITFRPLAQMTYTDGRIDTRTPGLTGTNNTMIPLLNSSFYRANPESSTLIYGVNESLYTTGVSGEIIPSIQFPLRLNLGPTYILAEYVSVEDKEAIGLRSSELTYYVEQHNIIESVASQRSNEVRIPLNIRNMTKELFWVCQRPEAENYNAWFLFTRDLAQTNAVKEPWWPDAILPLSQTRDYKVLPGFRNAFSEPLTGATLLYGNQERFDLDGPSMFRAFIPSLHYRKGPVINRYIYAYSFGIKNSLKGYEDKMFGTSYNPKGLANWDKLPKRELYLRLSYGRNNSTPPNLNIYTYTTSYNVLKVFGGRAGLLFDY
jgi:hypothetical protein